MKKLALAIIFLTNAAIVLAERPPATVETTHVQTQTWQPSIPVTGVIRSLNSATIISEVAGKITKMNFKEGDFVKKGTVLYELGSDILKAELKLNTTNFRLSKLQYERKKKLQKSNAISPAELDAAQAELEKNEAILAKTKAQLAQTIIKAPFDGTVGLANAYQGDFVSAGQKLVVLQQNDPVVFEMTVPEIYSSKIKKQLSVNVWSDSYNNKKFPGKIASYDVEINEKNQSLTVKATIKNTKNTLIPGSFMSGEVFLSEPKNVLSIPQISVQYEHEGPYVFRIIDNKAQKTKIKLGPQLGNKIIIISGLQAGDEIVSEGQIKLGDGTTVNILNQNKGAA